MNEPCGNRRRLLAAIATALVGGGCSALAPPRSEPVTLHVLTAKPPPRMTAATRGAVIEIAPVRAWPGYDTPQIAYRKSPFELDYFADNRWADAPARMLTPLLARAVEEGGSFHAVLQGPSVATADFRLDAELVRLVQDFSAPPSREELVLRVQLTDVRGRKVVAARVFEEVEPAPTDNAAGGVIAANVALQRALPRVVEFLRDEANGPTGRAAPTR